MTKAASKGKTMAKKAAPISALAARVAARRLAGEKWKELGKEERRAFLERARREVTKQDRQKATVVLARKVAQGNGLNWKDLPKERRRELVIETRRQG
jgi:hypothetical protein